MTYVLNEYLAKGIEQYVIEKKGEKENIEHQLKRPLQPYGKGLQEDESVVANPEDLKNVSFEGANVENSIFSEKDICEFNLDNATNFWEQVEKNHTKQMNTWAIFWYTTIFKNQGLCLNPTQSFVENIGFDGTGTNTGHRDNYSSNLSRQNYKIGFENNLTFIGPVMSFICIGTPLL